jgi:periplasmic protein TonB
LAVTRSTLSRIGPCIVVTIAAHACLLALPARPLGTVTGAATGPGVQVRFVQQPMPTSVAQAVPVTVEHALAAERLPPPLLANSEPLKYTPALTAAPILSTHPELPPLPGWALAGVANEDDQFVARALLHVAPAPLAPVVLAFPARFSDGGRFVGELTLFIDETGVVVRVRSEGEALPPLLEQAARSAFMNVRFRPGELAEHGVVKSRIRIEVVFESDAPLRIG